MSLRKGINYDTGFEPYGPDNSSRKTFDPVQVRQEMQIIAGELGCTHIRITGADPCRLFTAASEAVQAGLSVWFSPFPCNLGDAALQQYLVDCATKAEEIRKIADDTVFVLGAELSLFNSDFLPGNHLIERTRAFTEFERWKPYMNQKLRVFFSAAVTAVRQHFHGQITYAAGEWESIDWSLFDLVSVDLYRAKHNESIYAQQLNTYLSHGKPVAITEFGCCPVKGAAALGGNATFTILGFGENGLTVNEGWQYNEEEQVGYLKELVHLFNDARVSFAFWFTFADYEKRHSEILKFNLDMASYGLVKMLGADEKASYGLPWEPRRGFYAMRQLKI